MQNHHLIKVVLVSIISFFTHLHSVAQSDKDAVNQCFENYKAAILSDSGNVAVAYVSKQTIRYYDSLLQATISADSISLDKMEMVDKMMILMIRQTTSLEQLEPMDGKALLSFAVAQGMVGKSGIKNQGVGVVEIDNNSASGVITFNGEPSTNKFMYYREGDDWKVDLTSAFAPANEAFATLIKNTGKTENEYLIMTVEFVTSRKAIPGIWRPLR